VIGKRILKKFLRTVNERASCDSNYTITRDNELANNRQISVNNETSLNNDDGRVDTAVIDPNRVSIVVGLARGRKCWRLASTILRRNCENSAFDDGLKNAR
jgi:hypothetical protein